MYVIPDYPKAVQTSIDAQAYHGKRAITQRLGKHSEKHKTTIPKSENIKATAKLGTTVIDDL